ncbi:hypothetical protein [Staphylococcus shinii]
MSYSIETKYKTIEMKEAGYTVKEIMEVLLKAIMKKVGHIIEKLLPQYTPLQQKNRQTVNREIRNIPS